MRRLLLLLLLFPAPGCATFTYERAGDQAPAPVGTESGLRLGVVRFAGPAPSRFYPVWFSNTLQDPIGDLSRAVAEELRRSGRFADVLYLGAAPQSAADAQYYREVYGIDAILGGDVARFHVTAVAELWSLVPPFIVLWPLHFLGLPTAPSRDRVVLDATLTLQALAPGAGAWRLPEQRLSWHEHNWYALQRIPAIERAVQRHALDHFVTALAATVVRELATGRGDALLPRPRALPPAR